MVVAVLGAIAVGVGAVLMVWRGTEEVAGEKLPVHLGSREENMPACMREHLWYTSIEEFSTYFVEEKRAEEVLGWYRQEMSSRGYSLYDEKTLPPLRSLQGILDWGWIVFENENMGFAVVAFSGTFGGRTGCWYAVGRGRIEDLVPPGISRRLPSSDRAEGRELVPRYPGSVMLMYRVVGIWPVSCAVHYGTLENDLVRIREWFKEHLTASGWKVREENEVEGSLLAWFERGENEQVEVFVAPPTEEREYTRIDVVHDIWGFPPEDLASGEEPLPRYPASVILDYTIFALQPVRVGITYGTRAEVDEVYQWYVNLLEGQGWTLFPSENENYFFEAVKYQEAVLTLSVRPTPMGYNQVSLLYEKFSENLL